MTHTHSRNTFFRRLSALALVVGMLATSLASAAVLKADLNDDGYEDLVVGSPFEDVGSILDAGAISVFYGTARGLPRSPSRQWYQDSPASPVRRKPWIGLAIPLRLVTLTVMATTTWRSVCTEKILPG